MQLFCIVYDSRSGSTFLANQLMKNFNIIIPPESNFVAKIVKSKFNDPLSDRDLSKIYRILYNDGKFLDWNVSVEDIQCKLKIKNKRYSIRDVLEVIFTLYVEKTIKKFDCEYLFGLKKNFLQISKELNTIFPNCKWICLIRDGRGIFNSKRKSTNSVTQKPFTSSVLRASLGWKRYLKGIEKLEKENPLLQLVYYDDLILNTDQSTQSVAHFIGSTRTENVRGENVLYQIPERYGNLHYNISKSPLISRVTAWKTDLSRNQIRFYEKLSKRELLKFKFTLLDISLRHCEAIDYYIYILKDLCLFLFESLRLIKVRLVYTMAHSVDKAFHCFGIAKHD